MKTTQTMLNKLTLVLLEKFTETLTALPMKKSVRECLIDGYRQGLNDGVKHTIGILGVEVEK